MKKILMILITLMLLTSVASAATLNVGPKEKYKTIQTAVNAAHNGDTIYVKAGTYKETVQIKDKDLAFQGEKSRNRYLYPSVYGFDFGWTEDSLKVGSGDVNGFKITKSGVSYGVVGGNTVRNNYFYNCGVGAGGQSCSGNTIMNNKFSGNYNYDGVYLTENYDNLIKGNTFSKARNGLVLQWGATCTAITGNTFSGCKIGVKSGYLPSVLRGNTYKGNQVNVKIIDDF